jgi:hypothetical protein
MNISVDDNYPWEIKMDEPETGPSLNSRPNFPNTNFDGSPNFEKSNSDADMMELPKVLNVSVTFTPILDVLPSISKFDSKTSGGKSILIGSHGNQENFISRIQKENYLNPISRLIPTGIVSTPTGGIPKVNIDYKTPR